MENNINAGAQNPAHRQPPVNNTPVQKNPAPAAGKTEELLSEILRYQKNSARMARIASIAVIFIVAVFAVALALILPKMVVFVDRAGQSLTKIDGLIAEADSMMSDVDEIMGNVKGLIGESEILIENSNTMISNNTDAVTETIQKLNQMDFETLNKAIKDLSAVIEPLAKFFNIFNKNQ